jgi:hypothetical protein
MRILPYLPSTHSTKISILHSLSSALLPEVMVVVDAVSLNNHSVTLNCLVGFTLEYSFSSNYQYSKINQKKQLEYLERMPET